ncbi:MAG: hypothetical protein ACOX8X_05680 [Methanomethylophilus sp.]|jgi:hypothetical protein
MVYETELISEAEAGTLRSKYRGLLYAAKADINGVVIELCTSDREFVEMWRDNFYSASDRVRSHARLYVVKDDSVGPSVLKFEPNSKSSFLFNFDYYGWVKSIALGVAGYINEACHDIYSVHGAAVCVDGTGVTLIAPPKTGKTTQSWGLLRSPNASLISDDWFFVKFPSSGRPQIRASEKNCYVDADIGDVWEEYKPLVKNVHFDNRGRGIANIRWVDNGPTVVHECALSYVILMKRDRSDPQAVREMTADEALDYMINADLCNPHQIVRDEYRKGVRTEFFRRLFTDCRVYMVNTTGTPQETQEAIRGILGGSSCS